MLNKKNIQDLSSAYEEKKQGWNARWSDEEFSPPWKIKQIPEVIKDAVNSRWFPPQASILDIGCGSGEIAAWLAQQNFQVLGIDYSQAAIEKAKLEHGVVKGFLDYQTVDICREPSDVPRFNALLDRGCFHDIPETFASDYVKTVASYAVPGANFLLLFGGNKGKTKNILENDKLQQKLLTYIETAFESMFNLVKSEIILTERELLMPRIAVWMIRR